MVNRWIKRLFLCAVAVVSVYYTSTNILMNSDDVSLKPSAVHKEYKIMTVTKDAVTKLISSNAVMVFSKSYCPYCKRAKGVLAETGAKFKVVELDQEADGDKVQEYLAQLTGQRTVPNIFISGEHIGGCDDLLKIQGSGELKQKLAKI